MAVVIQGRHDRAKTRTGQSYPLIVIHEAGLKSRRRRISGDFAFVGTLHRPLRLASTSVLDDGLYVPPQFTRHQWTDGWLPFRA